jgi:hypothetical protein
MPCHINSPENLPLQSPDIWKVPSGKVEVAIVEEQERVRDRERERGQSRAPHPFSLSRSSPRRLCPVLRPVGAFFLTYPKRTLTNLSTHT